MVKVAPVVRPLKVVCKYLATSNFLTFYTVLEQCDQESQAKRNLKKQPTN